MVNEARLKALSLLETARAAHTQLPDRAIDLSRLSTLEIPDSASLYN